MSVFSTFCEWRLSQSLCRAYDKNTARLFLILSGTSAGMFTASVAFLPSSYAMDYIMLAVGEMVETESSTFQRGCVLFSLAGILGWPFSLTIAVPYVCFPLFSGPMNAKVLFISFCKAGSAVLVLTFIIIAIDSIFYRRFEFVAFNIINYNIFSRPSTGPAIFGTEPWWFYGANLSLMFNLLVPIAACSGPILVGFSLSKL